MRTTLLAIVAFAFSMASPPPIHAEHYRPMGNFRAAPMRVAPMRVAPRFYGGHVGGHVGAGAALGAAIGAAGAYVYQQSCYTWGWTGYYNFGQPVYRWIYTC